LVDLVAKYGVLEEDRLFNKHLVDFFCSVSLLVVHILQHVCAKHGN